MIDSMVHNHKKMSHYDRFDGSQPSNRCLIMIKLMVHNHRIDVSL